MIYLDYNASAPLDTKVREAMLPFLGERFGNSHSSHAMGKPLHDAVELAREHVATLLGAEPDEVLFTSGGTESNNHVIQGVASSLRGRGNHVIISAVEHPAVVNPCKHLQKLGYEVSVVGVDSTGWVEPKAVMEEIRPTTILISIMHAQNEVGTLQDVREIADIARSAGVLMHTDAAQSCGKVPMRVDELDVDFLSLASHKLCGPQGIGALYVRKGSPIDPLHHGAGHQGGRRAGTEPVALIVGLGEAARIARDQADAAHSLALRDRLHDGLRRKLGDEVVLLGHPSRRLPNTLCVGFRGRIGGALLAACPEICASTGAACHSGKGERSATMTAMNVPEDVAFGAVRFSVGRFTTADEIDRAVEVLASAVASTNRAAC